MNAEKFRVPGQVGESKLTVLDKQYDWGIYFWKKANGKPFTDGNGNVLNVSCVALITYLYIVMMKALFKELNRSQEIYIKMEMMIHNFRC